MNQDLDIKSRRVTLHYSAAFFVYFAAFCMIRSFISVYLLDKGFNYTQVGILTAFHTFITAAIQPNYALVFERYPKLGLRQFIALCCIPAVFCSFITFFLPSNLLFFIPIYIVFAICEIGLQSLMVSVGMEYVNVGIPLNTGLGRGMGSVGYAAANLLLGFLIVKYGSPVSQKLNIALMLLFAFLIITLPDPNATGSERQKDAEDDGAPADHLFTFLRRNHIFALFSLSLIFIFFGHSIVNTYMPDVAAQFGLGADFTGLANSIAAFLELIPMMFYEQISKRISPLKLLIISAVFFSIKLLTATLAVNAAGLLLSQCMQILGYATFAMASIYFANQAVRPHNRVLAQGLLIGANEAGFMTGSLFGGIILDHANIRTLLWIGVIVSIIGSTLMITAVSKFSQNGNKSL